MCYRDLIEDVYKHFDYECSPRGEPIREKLNVSFTLTDPRNRIPYLPERNYSISYLCAEATWYFAGRKDVAWIAPYSPFWLDVTEDGVSANSAYGSRIFAKHDRIDNGSHIQYDRVLEELRRDHDSRRAVIYLTQSSDHFHCKKDIGCATTLQAFIRDKKLHMTATLRSNDVILGVPYDVSAFTLIQEMLANDLDVELGSYHHFASSMHCYERNYEIAESVIRGQIPTSMPPMPELPRHTRLCVDALINFEQKCRECTDPSALSELLCAAGKYPIDTFFRDWMRIFVFHRAKKISKDVKRIAHESLEFEGYKRFKK